MVRRFEEGHLCVNHTGLIRESRKDNNLYMMSGIREGKIKVKLKPEKAGNSLSQGNVTGPLIFRATAQDGIKMNLIGGLRLAKVD